MKLKVLHYTGVYAPAWKWGGPPRSSANLAEGTAAQGHSVTVFTTNAGLENDATIPTDRAVRRNGVEVHYFPARMNLLGLQSSELEAAVRDRVAEFDIVHITGVWQPTSVAACRACEAANVPYVISPRGALSPYSFTQKPWKKWPYWWLYERRNCDRAAVIHYTATMEKAESKRLGLRARQVVIPNAIDLTAWWHDQVAGLAWRERLRALGITESTKVLLYAGRLHHKKGLDMLPEVFSVLADINYRLVLIGSDEDGSGAALALALAGRITHLPATDAAGLRAAYSGADLFILPSRHENFGNVVVEALACACPVVISDCVGVADQIVDIDGVKVLPRIAADWARSITRHFAEPIKPPRKPILDRFSCEGVCGEMTRVYLSLVNK